MTTTRPGLSRRTVLRSAAGAVAAAAAGSTSGLGTSSAVSAAGSRRALLHLTPTTGWACDPQRPYYLGGRLQLPHLQAAETAGPGGWRLATSSDEVAFSDAGDTIPLMGDTPAWSGSAVVDTGNTADLGGMECPDLFHIIADDGTAHWVLAASMDGWESGSLGTYAYWVGTWDGTRFTTDNLKPQWLDHGYDWYAAVTWPSATSPKIVRHAVAWMNNWKYAARRVPTLDTDGYNGQYSVVREIRLVRQPGGWYSLLSVPEPALATRLASRRSLGDLTVNGRRVLDVDAEAYLLTTDVTWTDATNVGLELLRSTDGTRHTNVGVFNGRVYVDRGPSETTSTPFAPYTQSEAPIDPTARYVHLSVVVDRNSVEVFVNAGHTVLSNQVYPAAGDHGLALYSDNGSAVFSGLSIRTL